MQSNPFAAPSLRAQAEQPVALGETPIWRHGSTVVVPKEAVLPDRCVKCNAPTSFKLYRKLYWHPSGYYFLLFVNVLVYLIVAILIRKKAAAHVGLCDRHRALRMAGFWVGWGGALLTLGSCTAGVATDQEGLLLLGFLGFFPAILTGALWARVVVPYKIDDHYAWLRVGKPFLESIRC
jgi:hypothetical protein